MANYTTENLVPVLNPKNGVLAIRVGDQVFPLPGGVDVSTTTAQPEDVRSGKYFFTAAGNRTAGTIPTVSATSSGSQITVPVGYIQTAQTFNVTGDSVYLCVSASDPVYYHLVHETYGGDYYRDPVDLDGKPVWTNGTYYILASANYSPQFISSSWVLRTSKSWDSAFNINSQAFPLYAGCFITSGGELVGIQPETLDSGTWTGREMVQNSAGYYEPVASESATSGLSYTKIVPNGGEMYSADALKHLDQIWNYDYKRDLKGFFSSTQNEMYPNSEAYFEGVSGPDTDGWFTFGNGAYGNYNSYNYDTGGSLFSAKLNNFTFAFKFKYAAGTLNEDSNMNTIFRLESSGGQFSITIFPDGTMHISSNATVEGDTSIPYALAADTEYSFVITCNDSRLRVIVNGILIADWRSRRNENDIYTIYVHWYGANPSSSTFYYKEMSLWGRVLDELAVYSTSSAYLPASSGGKTITGEERVSSWTVTSGARVAVFGGGVASNVNVDSTFYGIGSAGFYLLSGGTADTVNVSSGGRMVVYSGGTALNVTSQTGADITVSSGGTISYTGA